MCSRVLGPAMMPPLVTWPTTTTAVPLSLAKRMRRAAHSRTWPTLPGALSSDSMYTVWIESSHSSSARGIPPRSRRAPGARRPGAAPRPAEGGWTCRCPARRRSAPSSRARSRLPARSRAPACRCSSGRGAPARRRRGFGAERTFRPSAFPSFRPLPPPRSAPPPRYSTRRTLRTGPPTWGDRGRTRRSDRPSGRAPFSGRLALGEVLEAGARLPEVEIEMAGGPVAMLGDHDLRLALGGLPFVLVLGVHLGPVDEDHDVRILLDGPRIAQIGQDGLPVTAPLLRGPRELRERDDRRLELARERLERAGNVGDLLDPVLLVLRAAHQLEVIH